MLKRGKGIVILCCMLVLYLGGCAQHSQFVSSYPQIQKILLTAGSDGDKSMEIELVYLRDMLGWDLSKTNYYISVDDETKGEPCYGFADEGPREVVFGSISRKEVQKKMKEQLIVDKLLAQTNGNLKSQKDIKSLIYDLQVQPKDIFIIDDGYSIHGMSISHDIIQQALQQGGRQEAIAYLKLPNYQN